MRFFKILLPTLLFGVGSFAQEKSDSFYERQVAPTFKRLGDKTSISVITASVPAVLLAHTQDDSIRDQWKDHQKMSEEEAHKGDLLGSGIPGGLIALGQMYFGDEMEGESHLRAILSAGVATYGLKYTVNRKRPGESRDYLSFPSGHTSTTFASATSLTYAYGWRAAVVAYPLAVFTASSRWSDDAHWFSDTAGGAFIGFLFGRATYYSSHETVSSWVFTPIWVRDRQGLIASYSF